MRSRPPADSLTVMVEAPASKAFSTNSLTALAGRSTTSPAAMRLTSSEGSLLIDMPNPEWLMTKYKRKWQGYDSANTSIGQGYVLINPMQLAVMPARLASGKLLQPRLLMAGGRKPAPDVAAKPEHLEIVRSAMAAVVNGSGTAVASKLPLDGILMAGKTGTAQVFRLESRGHQGNWALRDHELLSPLAPLTPALASCQTTRNLSPSAMTRALF